MREFTPPPRTVSTTLVNWPNDVLVKRVLPAAGGWKLGWLNALNASKRISKLKCSPSFGILVRLMTLRSWLTMFGPFHPLYGVLPNCPAPGKSKQGVVWPGVQRTGLLAVPLMVINPEFGLMKKTPVAVLKTPSWLWNWLIDIFLSMALSGTLVAPRPPPFGKRFDDIVYGAPELQRVRPCKFQPPTMVFTKPLALPSTLWPLPTGRG